MKQIVYQTVGTCSRIIALTGDHGRIVDIQFEGGCHGNLQGISMLVKGMEYDEVINKLQGIRCGMKTTSCPDQLAEAVKRLKAEEGA